MVALVRNVESRSFNDRMFDLLDVIDYRAVTTDEDREKIFRLRYDAYLRDEGIMPKFDRRLSDRYDDLDNTTIFAMYISGELASTIRVSVVTSEFQECPSMDVFSDILRPCLDAGQVLIDPTRHAAEQKFSNEFPGMLPYLTIRLPWMVAEHYQADAILAGVRAEHRAFYRRTFGSRQLGDARYYPTLVRPHYLTYGDYPKVRDWVHQRYPTFRSSAFERRMLLEGANPLSLGTARGEAGLVPTAQGA